MAAWGQRGPAANPQALNRFAYVLNNPLKSGDPTGHCNPILGMFNGSCYREAAYISYHSQSGADVLLGETYRFFDSALAGVGAMAAAPAIEAVGGAIAAHISGAGAADVLAPYEENGGHHIIASANVEAAATRSTNPIVGKMLAVPNQVLEDMGVQHLGVDSLTSKQQTLLREFAKSGAPNTWEAQRDIAQKSLVEAGVVSRTAQVWATKAYEQMVSLLPGGPPRTPYQ